MIDQARKALVMVADSDPRMRMVLSACLEGEGYEVEEAANGWDLLERIRVRAPDVLLVDPWLPSDGGSVVEELGELGGECKPRLGLMVNPEKFTEAERLIGRGDGILLSKPTNAESILFAVRRLLGGESKQQTQLAVDGAQCGYEEMLGTVREALRGGALKRAETLLMQAGTIGGDDSAFLNLAGIVHECGGRKRLAKKLYGRAIRLDRKYLPAQLNMRRLYELNTFGHTRLIVALGDETVA